MYWFPEKQALCCIFLTDVAHKQNFIHTEIWSFQYKVGAMDLLLIYLLLFLIFFKVCEIACLVSNWFIHSKCMLIMQELCSSLISALGKIRAYSEAFSVYNILKYSKRTMCKALHEKILHILVAGRLLKDAYVVVKVLSKYLFIHI